MHLLSMYGTWHLTAADSLFFHTRLCSCRPCIRCHATSGAACIQQIRKYKPCHAPLQAQKTHCTMSTTLYIWAEQMLATIKRQERPAYSPSSEHLTRVCCFLCKRAEYAKAFGLAIFMSHAPAQHAAEHASIVFEAARAAGSELEQGALRTIMARCLLDGTPAFLKSCRQVCVGTLILRVQYVVFSLYGSNAS